MGEFGKRWEYNRATWTAKSCGESGLLSKLVDNGVLAALLDAYCAYVLGHHVGFCWCLFVLNWARWRLQT